MWGERKLFYRPMIRSQSYSEPVSLGHKLHKCFSVAPSPTFGGTGWLEGAEVGYFPSPCQLDANKYPNRLGSGKIFSLTDSLGRFKKVQKGRGGARGQSTGYALIRGRGSAQFS